MGVYIKGLNKKDISDLRVHKYGGAYEFVEHEDIIEVKTPHERLYEETKIIEFAKDMKISASDYATWWYGEDAVIEAEPNEDCRTCKNYNTEKCNMCGVEADYYEAEAE